MSESPEETTDETRVKSALEGLRAAVRQRQAERAGQGSGEALRALLRELKDRETVLEPVPKRDGSLGSSLAASLRWVVYRIFFRWHARIVWKQQSEFNRTATRLLQDLVERDRDRSAELARLKARLDERDRPEDGERPG